MLVRFGNKSNKLSDIESQNFGCVLNYLRVKCQDKVLVSTFGRINVKFRINSKCNIQSFGICFFTSIFRLRSSFRVQSILFIC
jgi:hypothetical protein